MIGFQPFETKIWNDVRTYLPRLFSCRFAQAQLIEVNAHSLFSKWFSESGKLVASLFSRIREAVEEEDTLVFVLVDEVGLKYW